MEGSPQIARSSLQRLATLDQRTRIFCGHEYTKSNLEFACSLEPGNAALQSKLDAVRRLGESRRPSIPSTIGEELRTNPFLRTNDVCIQCTTDSEGDPVQTLAAIRRGKDTFTAVGKAITFFL